MSVGAQEYQVNLKNWNVKDGLSDRQVNAIYKDSRGFIWACTKKGLNRFDSHNFKVYTKEKDGLLFDHIVNITEDANGQFWLLGSSRFDKNDLFVFDPLTKKVTSFKEKTGYQEDFAFNFLQKFNDSVLFFGDMRGLFFFTWSPANGLRKIPFPVHVAEMLTITNHGSFWVQDSSFRLCEVDMNGRLLRRLKTAHSVNFIQEPTISNYAVYKQMPGQKHTYMPAAGVQVYGDSAKLLNVYPYFGRVVFNTGVDSVIFSAGSLYKDSNLVINLIAEGNPGLKSNLTSVIVEGDGQIWMANVFGISLLKVRRNRFHKLLYQDIKDFSQNSYRTLLVTDNKLYAVNEFLGVTQVSLYINDADKAETFSADITGNYSLYKKDDGRMFGLQFSEMYMFDKHWTILGLPEQKLKRNFWKIREISNDSFLLATSSGLVWFSLDKYRFSDFTGYNRFTELQNGIVLDIIDDRNGRRWLCSNMGLYELDDARGIVARYSSADTGKHFLPTHNVQHIYRDSDGFYWIGSVNGLIRWDRAHNKYKLFTQEDGLSNNNIYAVYEDSVHRLWLSSDYGIMQFNKATSGVRTYLVGDGITYNEFNRISHTSDADGNIYFGSLDGITMFNPRDFHPGNDGEKSAILAVSAFEQYDGSVNKMVDKTADIIHTSAITLMPGDRFFTLNFALLTYNDAMHTTYYWKIEGEDSAWISLKEPSLRISGLPYGKMTLRIKAQASDGGWGRNELAFQINVVKPFYLRTGFIILAILLLAGSIAVVYRWRVFVLEKENEHLDKMVKEKTAALEETISQLQVSSKQKDILMKEIHHRVKNNLQVISTLLNLQLSKIGDKAARHTLEESSARINSIALVHYQLYKGQQLNAIELSGFATELLLQLQGVYLKPEQELHLENNIPETWLDIDTAMPLGLVLNELMTNSFKYAYGNNRHCSMQIGLVHRDNIFILQYCDNGPGLPEGYDVHTGTSLGMTIIKSLAKQLGGKFSYSAADNCFLIHFLDTSARKNIA